jgi:alpha-1,2-mannosyltransferase
VLGFGLARRFHVAGASVAEVATVGIVACLISPVSWVHHYHWVVVVILALLGADPLRERWRLYAASAVTVWFLCRLPWWGISWLNHRDWPRLPGRLLAERRHGRWGPRAGAALAVVAAVCRAGWLSRRRLR